MKRNNSFHSSVAITKESRLQILSGNKLQGLDKRSSYDISDPSQPSQPSRHDNALPSRRSSYDGSPYPHCLIQDTIRRPKAQQIPESTIDSNPNNARPS